MRDSKIMQPVRTNRTHPTRVKKAKTRKPNAKAKDWQALFIEKLSQVGNVRLACLSAKVSRSTVYQARWAAEAARAKDENSTGVSKQYDDFAAHWDSAIEEACDRLEEEAWRRAVNGTPKPVFYQGDKCGSVQEYSDTLLVLLLKAHRPDKYRDRHELTGKDGAPLGTSTVIYLPDNGRANNPAPASGTPGEISSE